MYCVTSAIAHSIVPYLVTLTGMTITAMAVERWLHMSRGTLITVRRVYIIESALFTCTSNLRGALQIAWDETALWYWYSYSFDHWRTHGFLLLYGLISYVFQSVSNHLSASTASSCNDQRCWPRCYRPWKVQEVCSYNTLDYGAVLVELLAVCTLHRFC